LGERANAEVERLIAEYAPSPLGEDVQEELTEMMRVEARRWGMDSLPKPE